MTAPEKIWVNADDNTDGCCPVETDLDDVGRFFDVGQAVEYTRSDLIAARAADTRVSTGSLLEDAALYAAANPMPISLVAEAPASPLGAVMEVPEVRALVEAAKGLRVRYDIMGCGDGLEALALDAALAPFAQKGE